MPDGVPEGYKCKIMEEGKRQKQIGGLIQEELSQIFQRLGLSIVDGGMVSITSVKITPDLLEARIYLSVFNAKDNRSVLKKIEERAWEVKKELASRVKHQLRRIPELRFFPDDTLDHVFRMEELFKQIHKDEEKKGEKDE
jgi:ribosome-binding factor A